MKKAVGSLRLELAQYREMKTFAQFSGDLDDAVKEQFAFGKALTEILVQPLQKPYCEWEQIVILVTSLAKVTVGIDVKQIRPFFDKFLPFFGEHYANVVSDITDGKVLSDGDKATIVAAAKEFLAQNV